MQQPTASHKHANSANDWVNDNTNKIAGGADSTNTERPISRSIKRPAVGDSSADMNSAAEDHGYMRLGPAEFRLPVRQ